MKVENMTPQAAQTTPRVEAPVINVDEIKSILYLGIRGDLRLTKTGSDHAVDTYA
jgi:hypothetical protein